MNDKDFLSILDTKSEDVINLIDKAVQIKNGNQKVNRHNAVELRGYSSSKPLEGKNAVLLFEKPSLRTRVSFEVGLRQLGSNCIYLSKEDVGLGIREPVAHVSKVLDRWVDVIVARVFSHESLQELAINTKIPVINALSDFEHPCQAIGDLLTIFEHKKGFHNLKVAFIGDGNNVATSLALACSSVGANFVLASPDKYQIPKSAWQEATRRASSNGSNINHTTVPQKALDEADVIYTDVWTSMGQDSEREKRLREFTGYQVTPDLLNYAKPDSIFMHDMPAHEGEEVAAGMLEHPNSVVFDQAENRLHAQKAILVTLLS